jgi:hypothetical protein
VNAAIFGSCVSRDLFEDPTLRKVLGNYAARSSVISAVAQPLPIDQERVVLPSPWQRRCVLADFQKTFLTSLREEKPRWLVVDLIDEGFDLLRTSETCVTHSSALSAAGLSSAPDFEFEPVRRMSSRGVSLFQHAAIDFAQRVMEVIPAERVVIHRALWSTDYRAEGERSSFVGERRLLCEQQNAMLTAGYDVLACPFDGRAMSIERDPERHVADAHHRWGLEPYHYEETYNAFASDQLRAAFGLA